MASDSHDFDLTHAFGPGWATRTEMAASSQLIDAEKEILAGLTDKQLSVLVGYLERSTAADLTARHPDIARRVHLYTLRKIVSAVKAGDQDL